MDAPDEGVRDVVNLVVNASIFFLTHPNAELADVASQYTIHPDELANLREVEPNAREIDVILGWCQV